MDKVTVVGAGLAGCEAAWQLAKRGVSVELIEMKPSKKSPAHKSDDFCELVCSNSLRGADLSCAPGLLKEEMRRLNSLIISCADRTKIPAGGALAVDREGFAKSVTEEIAKTPYINIVSREVNEIPKDEFCIIATGPLTDGLLAEDIKNFFGGDYLHFFDAAAPVITIESVNMSSAFKASRYDKGESDEGDYINCPLNKDEYDAFVTELVKAEEAPVHGFEDSGVFEGCMPVEVMARRGIDTLRHGPMKPVGLKLPDSGDMPYAVVQLRRDNAKGTLYNMVGFQTHLKFGEQKRVFSMIPALKDAEFVRYGVMHRNSYINSPKLLDRYYRTLKNPKLMFAGQITGVEGYIESAASGMYAGINMARMVKGQELLSLPAQTATGALAMYVSDKTIEKFQPMNINFGIMTPLDFRVKGKAAKKLEISKRALTVLDDIIAKENVNGTVFEL